MLRFTSLLLLVACATPARQTAVPSPPIENQKSITRYQLPATEVRPMDGRHSSQHTYTTLSGSLELVGTGAMTARLVLDSVSQTSYIVCRGGKPWDGSTRQACVASVPEDAGKPRRDTIALAGAASWAGDKLVITVSKELQPDKARAPFTVKISLACSSEEAGLACAIEERSYTPLWGIHELRFVRARHATPPVARAAQR